MHTKDALISISIATLPIINIDDLTGPELIGATTIMTVWDLRAK